MVSDPVPTADTETIYMCCQVRYRLLHFTYLLLIGIYNTLFQRDIKEESLFAFVASCLLCLHFWCLEMTTQRLMERRRDGRRIGKASVILLNLPHGMSGLRVTTNYVSQVGQPHNLNSVLKEALYHATWWRVVWWTGICVADEPTCQSRPSHITEDSKLHSRIQTLLHLSENALYINVSSKYVSRRRQYRTWL